MILFVLWAIGAVVFSLGLPYVLRPSQLKNHSLPWESGDTVSYVGLAFFSLCLYVLTTLVLLARV